MADNGLAPDVHQPAAIAAQQQPVTTVRRCLVIGVVVGMILGHLYINFLIPRLAMIPATYPQANFQHNTSNYYDVLNITSDANANEIEIARDVRLSELAETTITTKAATINLTGRAQMEEVRQAFKYLQGLDRCLYDFEVLGLGFQRYLRCWYMFYYNSYKRHVGKFL